MSTSKIDSQLDPAVLKKAQDSVSYYMGGPGYAPGSFALALIECLFKADRENFAKLRTVFPEYAQAVLEIRNPEEAKQESPVSDNLWED